MTDAALPKKTLSNRLLQLQPQRAHTDFFPSFTNGPQRPDFSILTTPLCSGVSPTQAQSSQPRMPPPAANPRGCPVARQTQPPDQWARWTSGCRAERKWSMQEREAASAILGLPGSGGKGSARDAQTSSAANKWLCLIRKPLGNCSHHSPKLPRLNHLPAAGESAHYLRPDCTSSLRSAA